MGGGQSSNDGHGEISKNYLKGVENS